MKSDNQNVQRWLNNEDFQKFMRQVHADIFVGLKHGDSELETKVALALLAHEIVNSVNFDPVVPKK